MESLDGLIRLVRGVHSRRVSGFSGFGLIVYECLSHLPGLPLAEPVECVDAIDVAATLAKRSQRRSAHHDGFHLLDRALRLTHSAHYIAPPIGEPLKWRPKLPFGARTMTALLASRVEGVLLTASVSSDHSVRVFNAGELVFEAIGGMADV